MNGAARQKSLFERLRHFAFHKYFLLTRGLTLGVRGLVLDEAGRVFLIRHTYVRGWHLPGGGVEIGETLLEALERELMEEGNIEIIGAARLIGVYFNGHASRRDHVAVFVIRDFRRSAPKAPDREIAEAGFFAPDALPEGTTEGTRARILEVMGQAPVAADW